MYTLTCSFKAYNTSSFCPIVYDIVLCRCPAPRACVEKAKALRMYKKNPALYSAPNLLLIQFRFTRKKSFLCNRKHKRREFELSLHFFLFAAFLLYLNQAPVSNVSPFLPLLLPLLLSGPGLKLDTLPQGAIARNGSTGQRITRLFSKLNCGRFSRFVLV